MTRRIFDIPFSRDFRTPPVPSDTYHDTIVIDPIVQTWMTNMNVNYTDHIDMLADFSDTLESITGSPFSVSNVPGVNTGAIFLALANTVLNDVSFSELAPLSVLTLASSLVKKQAFLIHSDAGSGLWIVAKGRRGVHNGMREYLRRLGVRYLGPSDEYTRIPSRNNIRISADEIMSPALDTMGWFASLGAFVPIGNGSVQVDNWIKWRHRLGVTIGHSTAAVAEVQPFPGHTMPFAVSANSAVYQAHPLLNALTNSERLYTGAIHNTHHQATTNDADDQTPNVGAGSDYTTYTGTGVGLVGNWLINTYIPANAEPYISQDPDTIPVFGLPNGDGAPICECAKCKSIKRLATQYGFPSDAPDAYPTDIVAHTQIAVAAKLAIAHPTFQMIILAYDNYARITGLPLLSNMLYQSVLTIFTDAQLPQSKAAQLKAKFLAGSFAGLGTYAYQGLPVNHRFNIPVLDIKYFMDIAQLWFDSGFGHAQIESTSSYGQVGLMSYLQYYKNWHPTAAVQPLRDDYYASLCEGDEVLIAHIRWLDDHRSSYGTLVGPQGYSETVFEFGEMYYHAMAAYTQSLGASDVVRRCVGNFMAYLHFSRMIYLAERILRQAQIAYQAWVDGGSPGSGPLFDATTASDALYAPQVDALLRFCADTAWSLQTQWFALYYGYAKHAGSLARVISQAFDDLWNPFTDTGTWASRNTVNTAYPVLATYMSDMHAFIAQDVLDYPRISSTAYVPITEAQEIDLVKVGPKSPRTGQDTTAYFSGNDAPLDYVDFAFEVTNQTTSLIIEGFSDVGAAGNQILELTYPDQSVHLTDYDIENARSGTPVTTMYGLSSLQTGVHRLRVRLYSASSTMRLKIPYNLPFVRLGQLNRLLHTDANRPTFFWVPTTCASFLLHDPDPSNNLNTPTFTVGSSSRSATELFDLDGKSARVWKVTVSVNDRGVAWGVANTNGRFKLLNLDNIFANFEDQLLVPRVRSTLAVIDPALAPDQLPGLVAWYPSASGDVTLVSGKVSADVDHSGQGNDISQSNATLRPVYDATGINGAPALVGDGVGAVLTCTGLEIGNAATFGVAIKTTTVKAGPPAYVGDSAATIMGDNGFATNFLGVEDGVIKYRAQDGATWHELVGNTMVNDGAVHAIVVVHDQVTKTARIYVDTAAAPDAQGELVRYFQSKFISVLGGFNSADSFEGKIRNPVVYDRALNRAEVDALIRKLHAA